MDAGGTASKRGRLGGGCPRRGMGAWGMRPTRYGRLGSERRVGALAIRAPCRGARDARRTSSERSNGAWGVCACRGASAWAAHRTAVSETFQTLGQVACHPKPPYVPKNERFGNRGDSQASDFGTSWSESACFPRSTGGALTILSRYGLPNRSIIGRKSAFRQQAPLPTAGRETPLRCASLQRKGTTGETARAGRAPGTRRARCESARTGAADARQTALPHTMGREGYKNTPPKAMGRGARFPRRVKPRALAARQAAGRARRATGRRAATCRTTGKRTPYAFRTSTQRSNWAAPPPMGSQTPPPPTSASSGSSSFMQKPRPRPPAKPVFCLLGSSPSRTPSSSK